MDGLGFFPEKFATVTGVIMYFRFPRQKNCLRIWRNHVFQTFWNTFWEHLYYTFLGPFLGPLSIIFDILEILDIFRKYST